MLSNAINGAVGALVWWDFEAVKVEPSQLRTIVARYGMDSTVVVPEINVASALRTASANFAASRATGATARWKAEVVGQYDDGSIEIALLQHTRLSDQRADAEKVRWVQRDRVIYREARAGVPAGWVFTGTTSAAARLVDVCNDAVRFVPRDFVRNGVVNDPLVKAGAFPLRRGGGGFYFVPAGPALDLAEKVAAIVDDIPSDCVVNIAHVSGSEASHRSLAGSARSHVASLIGEYRERLDAWREATRVPRSDALSNVLEEFQALRAHAALYRSALSIEMDDLACEVDEMIGVVEGLIGMNESGMPPRYPKIVADLAAEAGGVEVPYAKIATLGLNEACTTTRWWTSGRGAKAAGLAGLRAVATATGVTFEPVASAA